MPSDHRLAALPALRTLAEEEARDIWTRHVRLFALHLPDMQTVADPNDASDGFFVTVEAQVERLADLSRPASRDAVARLVAERLGLECGATAPDFRREQYTLARPVWRVQTTNGFWVFGHVADFPHAPAGVVTDLPAVSGISDPTEALTLIALQVLA